MFFDVVSQSPDKPGSINVRFKERAKRGQRVSEAGRKGETESARWEGIDILFKYSFRYTLSDKNVRMGKVSGPFINNLAFSKCC